MRRQTQADLFGLSAVLLWSTVATAFKLALRYLEPVQLLCYATLFSLGVLFAIVAIQGKIGSCARSIRRDWRRSILLGALNPFLYYLVLFKAYDLLPAQVAQPLNYTWAITLALLSALVLRQRIRRRDLAALAIGYAGVAVLSTRGEWTRIQVDPLGVALALGSTLIWASYWIENTRDRRDAVVALFSNFLCAAPMTIAACAALSGFEPADPRGLLGAAYVGAVEMGVTFVLWLSALRRSSSAGRIGYLIFLSPILSLLFIREVLGEPIHASTPAGLALIIGGLLVSRLRRRETTESAG